MKEVFCAVPKYCEVAVIPGISSALAVPAMQMIPLTSRLIAESFWVTTGTTQSGDISADIKLAAQSTATVIILMAMSKIEAIMDIFSREGKKDTPVAVIQNGTMPDEKKVTGTVNDICFKVQYAGLTNPAIIIIGEVVELHKLVQSTNYNTAGLQTQIFTG